ncbi:glycosyltransferase family 4 protein [Thalassospira xiamenensis]|uniref:Glycosyl transferase n=1 Tax=Thalassospira xiamenensis TaxID=220697 RepID=A0A367XCY2_9PROT|nr:glycosyltransferase family 4 protein [Thalassospira xiamenensis]KZB52550.1 glycosyl transferase [Thalassospira xiamenensis]RCK51535.1 glycosyl transferase [Thalassospira xiamenensis]
MSASEIKTQSVYRPEQQAQGADYRPAVILQVLPELDTGGVERGTVDIARAIVDGGGVALVASQGGRLERELDRFGARHITLPLKSKNLFTMRRNIDALVDLIRAEGVDIIHARSRAPAWSAYFAARKAGIPFVTTFHGTYSGYNNLFKKRYNAIMTMGDQVIAISNHIADHIRKFYKMDPARLNIVPRGTNTDLFNPENVSQERLIALSNQWRLTGEEYVIMLPGRITRWKGHCFLIKALPAVFEALGHRNVRCLMVGSDQGRTAYRDEVLALTKKLGLEDIVHIVDHCADMPAAYMLADVVACPSTDPEAFGRIPSEAQAMGRPVVSTAHGGAMETVLPGETGWLVTPNEVDQLSVALTQVLRLTPEKRAALAQKGRRHVIENYSLTQMAEKTLAVYEKALKGAIRTAA